MYVCTCVHIHVHVPYSGKFCVVQCSQMVHLWIRWSSAKTAKNWTPRKFSAIEYVHVQCCAPSLLTFPSVADWSVQIQGRQSVHCFHSQSPCHAPCLSSAIGTCFPRHRWPVSQATSMPCLGESPWVVQASSHCASDTSVVNLKQRLHCRWSIDQQKWAELGSGWG